MCEPLCPNASSGCPTNLVLNSRHGTPNYLWHDQTQQTSTTTLSSRSVATSTVKINKQTCYGLASIPSSATIRPTDEQRICLQPDPDTTKQLWFHHSCRDRTAPRAYGMVVESSLIYEACLKVAAETYKVNAAEWIGRKRGKNNW